jgi:hypothetical protein
MLTPWEAWNVENTRLSLGCIKTNCLAIHRDDGLFIITALQKAEQENKHLRVQLEELRTLQDPGGAGSVSR